MNEELMEMILKLSMAFLSSGLIGFEREINQSSAGIKTHILVGIASALIGLIQLEAIEFAISSNTSVISTDPVRLVAQVVSGIGFLGAGAIIVTKRTISGLTTAASIWSVAMIGIAIGMGLYQMATMSFIFVIGTLILFKRVIVINTPESLVVKYLDRKDSQKQLYDVLENLEFDVETVRVDVSSLGDELLFTHVFRVKTPRKFKFETLVKELMATKFVLSVERTNTE